MGRAVTTTLAGPDHVEYGAIEVVDVAPGVALALTRGLHPKPYAWTDPNEDVVAAVVGPRATLLVVADAHNGALSAEVAVEAVLRELGADPPADLADHDLVSLFDRVNRAVRDATRGGPYATEESRTTLALALVADGSVRWAAMGDSAVYAPDGELTHGDHRFVGWPMSAPHVDRALQRGRARLRREESGDGWVALVSDGFANFAGSDPGAEASRAVAGSSGAVGAAEALVARAFDGGAGDNVAVAIVRGA